MGKEPSLKVGDKQWLGQGQACAPSSGELAVGLGSGSGLLAAHLSSSIQHGPQSSAHV